MGDEDFDSALDPPLRIFERLSQIAGYAWDESRPPAHSSYDNWYAFLTPLIAFSSLWRVAMEIA